MNVFLERWQLGEEHEKKIDLCATHALESSDATTGIETIASFRPTGWIGSPHPDLGHQRAVLGKAAPKLARVTVLTEWSGTRYDRPQMRAWRVCPRCGAPAPESELAGAGVHISCDLDEALTEAGLPDQVSRDEIRQVLRGEP